jgi:hypothetical protein
VFGSSYCSPFNDTLILTWYGTCQWFIDLGGGYSVFAELTSLGMVIRLIIEGSGIVGLYADGRAVPINCLEMSGVAIADSHYTGGCASNLIPHYAYYWAN